MLKDLTPQEFARVYKDHIVNDFARGERRPLYSIEQMFRRGVYAGKAYVKDDRMLAYAGILGAQGETAVLLDYFAVVSGLRGQGIGGQFLGRLRQETDCGGILIESELPASAKDDQDRQVRERRIAFYQRNGAQLAKQCWHSFGVDYHLLWLPVHTPLGQIDAGQEILRLYGVSTPKAILGAMTRVFS